MSCDLKTCGNQGSCFIILFLKHYTMIKSVSKEKIHINQFILVCICLKTKIKNSKGVTKTIGFKAQLFPLIEVAVQSIQFLSFQLSLSIRP